VCVLGYAGPGDIEAADEHYQALFEHQPIAQESYRLIKEARITRLAAVDRAQELAFANATISSPP
jgi:hypothetical protein